MAKQSYGTSTGGVNRSEKGDLPSDRNTMSYGRGPLTDLSSKGSLPSDRKFGGAYGSAPKAAPGKGNPPANLPKPTGVQTVTPVRAKNIPRSYVPSRIKQIFDPTPFATPVAKKPVVTTKPTTRGSTTPTRATQPARMAVNPRTGNTTGFNTGKTTGSSVSKSGVATKTNQSAYGRQMSNAARNQPAGPMGGGGSRSSTSGGSSRTSSGSRTAGTSRTGGTQRNDPVRG